MRLMIDLTKEAENIFDPAMKVQTLLMKLGLRVHKFKAAEETKMLNELLKIYDNPLEVKKYINDKLVEIDDDLRKRGLKDAGMTIELLNA